MNRLFLFLSLFTSGFATAQYDRPESRVWAMGNRVGLDFRGGAPIPITTQLANSMEAAASICDTEGNLLLYTNGLTVWNRLGVVMPNGTELTGPGIPNQVSTLSTTQGAAIVPVPGSPGKYYLFSLTQISNCTLFCNLIDMSLDNGYGAVDTTFALRGIPIRRALSEKMTPVAGCNNTIWLMLHEGVHRFLAYRIDPAGIDTIPVVSELGYFGPGAYHQGVIKFSPDRSRMLNCNFRPMTPGVSAGLEVFDFDRATGLLSNPVVLDSSGFYGGAFSPDGSKVYAGNATVPFTGTAYQYDLNAADPAASRTELGLCGQYTDMKLGPDRKIYFGSLVEGARNNNYKYMGRIDFPDLAGIACGFRDSVPSLVFPHTALESLGSLSQGMPNDVAVPVPDDPEYHRSDLVLCTPPKDYPLQAPRSFFSFLWDDGSTNRFRNISARGIYWVESSDACHTRTDTFAVGGTDMPPLIIYQHNDTLRASTGFSDYRWFRNNNPIAGATTAEYVFSANGTYSVIASYNENCRDTAVYEVRTAGLITTKKNEVSVYPNPATHTIHLEASVSYEQLVVRTMDGKIVLARPYSPVLDISTLEKGLYFLELHCKDHPAVFTRFIRQQ